MLKRLSSLLASILLLSSVTVTIPVYANVDGESGDSTTSTGSDTDQSKPDGNKVEMNKDEARKKGQQIVKDMEAKKEGMKDKTTEVRKKICEERKTGITKKGGTLGTNASRHLEVFSNLLTKAQKFKTKKGLNPADFDSLVAAAEAAKIKATDSVAALKALAGTVDCSSANVAEQVAAIKAAAEQARTDLKAYRKAVKAVFQSLRDALAAQKPDETEDTNKPESTETTGGGTQ